MGHQTVLSKKANSVLIYPAHPLFAVPLWIQVPNTFLLTQTHAGQISIHYSQGSKYLQVEHQAAFMSFVFINILSTSVMCYVTHFHITINTFGLFWACNSHRSNLDIQTFSYLGNVSAKPTTWLS